MKLPLSILALSLASAAYAQTTLTPPAVATPLPAPVATVVAGGSVTISWPAVTQTTTNTAITTAITYNLWGVETGTAVEENSGITGTSVTHTGMTAGLTCWEVTASTAGDIDSAGSPAACVNVVAATPQLSAPASITITIPPGAAP